MSFFSDLLAENKLERHDGRSLWKYGLKRGHYDTLKDRFANATQLHYLDPRDCTLFYALWWRFAYDGGSPSKEIIFNAFRTNRNLFNSEEFYIRARAGANQLRLQWLRNVNTLYLRTMLLQGGLPLSHISKHSGPYTSFLETILELNPKRIEDFAFDSSVVNILPGVSRNEDVYSSCLEIVRAILSGDEEYLNYFNQDDSLQEISQKLIVKNRLIRQQNHLRSRHKFFWKLDICEKKIELNFTSTDITGAEFCNIFLFGNESYHSTEFKLFFENELVCKYVRNAGGDYSVIYSSRQSIQWTGKYESAKVYLISSNGMHFDSNFLINAYPKISEPTLWKEVSESTWILEKGSRTSAKKGLVLYLDDGADVNVQYSRVCIGNTNFIYQIFEGDIDVLGETFQSNATKFEWYINEQRPAWIERANYSIVSGRPKVFVYNDNGQLVNNYVKKWRVFGSNPWKEWNEAFQPGLLQVLVAFNGVEEIDYVYNLNGFELNLTNANFDNATYQVVFSVFTLSLTQDADFKIQHLNNNLISITRNGHTSRSISGNLSSIGQTRSLLFDIVSPFRGVQLIDSCEKIIAHGTLMTFSQFPGCRLILQDSELDFFLYNRARPNVKIRLQISSKILPLQYFESTISQLMSLSDPINNQGDVVMEISKRVNGQREIQATYCFNRYVQRLGFNILENGNIQIGNLNAGQKVGLLPLHSPDVTLEVIELDVKDETVVFDKIGDTLQYLVFSYLRQDMIFPLFIHGERSDTENVKQIRNARLAAYYDRLMNSDKDSLIWRQVLEAYRFCVNNSLPFVVFDCLRACSHSPKLAARLYILLMSEDVSGEFIDGKYNDLENDLGIFFHWISGSDWHDAISFIHPLQPSPRVLNYYLEGISRVFSLHPFILFTHIKRFVIQGVVPFRANVAINAWIGELQSNLGEAVITGIPNEYPGVSDNYKPIIPVAENNFHIKLLLRTPVAIALSIFNKEHGMWLPEAAQIRRNMKYSYLLDSEWYAKAIIYSLSRINY